MTKVNPLFGLWLKSADTKSEGDFGRKSIFSNCTIDSRYNIWYNTIDDISYTNPK